MAYRTDCHYGYTCLCWGIYHISDFQMIQYILVIACFLSALLFLVRRAIQKYLHRKEGCEGCTISKAHQAQERMEE